MPWLELCLLLTWSCLLAWYPCCGTPGYEECEYCSGSGNNAPEYMTLVLSGIANDNCASCDNFNGTHVLQQQAADCSWRKTHGTYCSAGACSSAVFASVTYDEDGGGLYWVSAGFTTDYVPTITCVLREQYRFRRSSVAAPDCLELDDYALDTDTTYSDRASGAQSCDITSATASISSGDTT